MSKKDKILVIRIGAIGDVVHTTNLVHSVKQKYPESEIHYMTGNLQACFLENDADITKVYVVSKKDLTYTNIIKLSKQLRQENYDVIINLQPSFKLRFLVTLAKADKQLNYKKTFKMHAVENFWQTAKKYYKDIELPETMKLYLSSEAKKYATDQLIFLKKPVIAFNAGGIMSPRQGRTYPVEKWVALGKLVKEKFNASIILTGVKEDEEALAELIAMEGVVSFIGKTTVEQNAAIIAQCDLMISGDSGPLHIATAFSVPSVGLYGSMPISRTGTYGRNCVSICSDMQCVPCNRRKCRYIKNSSEVYTPCMKDINCSDIIVEYEKLLGSTIKENSVL